MSPQEDSMLRISPLLLTLTCQTPSKTTFTESEELAELVQVVLLTLSLPRRSTVWLTNLSSFSERLAKKSHRIWKILEEVVVVAVSKRETTTPCRSIRILETLLLPMLSISHNITSLMPLLKQLHIRFRTPTKVPSTMDLSQNRLTTQTLITLSNLALKMVITRESTKPTTRMVQMLKMARNGVQLRPHLIEKCIRN